MNRPSIQGVNRNILKIFQIAPYVKSVLFWTFREIGSTVFSAMLLRVMDSSKKSGVQGVK